MLPIGRWRGYGGDTDYQGVTWGTVTWACGLWAKTERLTVFGTVHAPLIPPLIAAKEFVTADHVGEGRFGLNLVCGWNESEFEMFGATLRDHEARYEYAQEWLDIVKLAWSPQMGFRFRWAVLQIKGRTGQAQTLWRDASVDHECRRVGDWPSLHYYRHAVIDNADWAAVDEILRMKNITPQTPSPEEFQRTRNHQANGMAGLPLVGDPDAVAQDMARLAALGLRGIAVSFVNYLDELPFFCAEVLPRLARAGLREPPGSAAARVPA